ncbi:MAG: hypothetical protein HQ512_04865 [Rhodospirillales bacterium]|nr:hypothetical protein [Rhodospirillales bacterium]
MWHTLRQIFKFMQVYRKYWLAPLILGLLLLGGFLVAIQGSAVAPFIYAIF